MIKYGYDIIQCEKLDKDFVDKLDIYNYTNGKKLAIQVRNTKNIDKTVLRKLNDIKDKYNADIKISVIGPYNDDKIDNEVQRERYFLNTLYDLNELYKIISQFEKIEEMIDPQWDKFDIMVYLAETIVRNVMYDPEYLLMKNKGIEIPINIRKQNKADYYDRTLRGILTRKSVCAGFSTIFKELANRNGIECKYVSGASYSENGVYRGGHAWNLIRINGIIYPLDITRKNTKYRNGDFSNIDDLSCDIEKNKKTHRPYNTINNEGLTKLDEDIIKKSKKKTTIRKHYNSTTYKIIRSDKSKFVLSQIGMYKGLYRYLYSEIKNDGSYDIPKILFSESNLAKEINDQKFEKSDHYNQFITSFTNVLFSRENILDSKNKYTKYIGSCELPNKNGYVQNNSEIIKTENAIKKFKLDNIKSQKRQDGSTVTLVQFANNTTNNCKYEYYVYVLSPGPTVLEYNIYSNSDYFSMQSSVVVNSILSNEKLRESLEHKGIIR